MNERRDEAVDASGAFARERERSWWSAVGGFETHRLVRQEDTTNAENKVANVFFATLGVHPSPNDHIQLSGFLVQRFIADSGESGWRSEDLFLSYAHDFRLGDRTMIVTGARLTAPTSLLSQKAGIVTSPRVSIALDKVFGPYLRVQPRVYGDANIARYRSAEGGAANAKYGLGMGVSAELSMPFHPVLSLGVDAATRYSWYYDVGDGDPRQSGSFVGTVDDTQFPRQPIQQSYDMEVFVRYLLPPLAGVRTDATIALANGDSTIGTTSVLRGTGVARAYGAYRNTAEVYATLAMRY